MNKPDYDGLLLSRIQGNIFESSLNEECSSPVFIRRFMNSDVAYRMDKGFFLCTAQSKLQVLDEIDEQYGKSAYGKDKYSDEEMYWIGYIYRYWAEMYKMRSDVIYHICNGREMKNYYDIYHSLDPAKAIERIMEAKNYIPCVTKEDKNNKLKKLIEMSI